MSDARTMSGLVGVVRRHPTSIPLVCPCGGAVVLGGVDPETWCACGHAEHHAGDPGCYRPKCFCPGAREDHPEAAFYRCTTCGIVHRHLASLIPASTTTRR